MLYGRSTQPSAAARTPSVAAWAAISGGENSAMSCCRSAGIALMLILGDLHRFVDRTQSRSTGSSMSVCSDAVMLATRLPASPSSCVRAHRDRHHCDERDHREDRRGPAGSGEGRWPS